MKKVKTKKVLQKFSGPLENQVNIRTLSDQAYQAIRNSILNNQFLPGENLSITFLSSSLGISQTPVREALRRLSADGLIEYEAHKRPKVAGITLEDVRQVYEVRRVLEPHAADLVMQAILANLSIKEKLETLLNKAIEICNTKIEAVDLQSYLSIDLELYEIFLTASKETLFGAVLAFVGDRSLRIRTFLESATEDLGNHLIYEITREHIDIIKALLDVDKPESMRLLTHHLKNGEARTVTAIKTMASDEEGLRQAATPLLGLNGSGLLVN